MGVNFRNFHSVNCFLCTAQCEKREVLSHSMKKKNRHIHYLVHNFFSKSIAFTKFLRKKCEEREFLQFPHTVAQSVEK